MKKRRIFLKSLGAGLAAIGVSARSTAAESKSSTGPHVWVGRPEKYTTDVPVYCAHGG